MGGCPKRLNKCGVGEQRDAGEVDQGRSQDDDRERAVAGPVVDVVGRNGELAVGVKGTLRIDRPGLGRYA